MVAKKKSSEASTTFECDGLGSCIGAKLEPIIIEALKDFSKNNKFTRVVFVRQFRAFRLYRGDSHVDWINLNELNHRYNLRLPKFSGASREYQKPLKRAY